MYGNASVRRVALAWAATAGVLLCGACATSNEGSLRTVAPPASGRAYQTTMDHGPGTTTPALRDYRGAWASRLIAEPVIDSRGGHLGLLSDLIVHTSTGEVRYAIVSDMRSPRGERLFAAPVRRLWMTEENGLFLDIARERSDQQTWWIAERWPSLQDSVVWTEIDRLWDVPTLRTGERNDAYRVSRLMGRYVDDALPPEMRTK